MAKIIVCGTNKGGDCKTQDTILMTDYFGMIRKQRVLSIDLDPQCNYSKHYLSLDYDPANPSGKIPPLHPEYDPLTDDDWDGRSTIANIFYGKEVIPYPTHIPKVDIMPGHSLMLQEAEAVTKDEVKHKVHLRLKEFLRLEEVQQLYDYILIDTPPSKGPLTISAIKACSHMLIPAQMEDDSLDGIYGMLQLWRQETYIRPESDPINLIGIVPNRVKANTSLHMSIMEHLKTLEQTKDYMFENFIKSRVIYGELRLKEEHPKSVFDLSKNHPARVECEQVCEEIERRMI